MNRRDFIATGAMALLVPPAFASADEPYLIRDLYNRDRSFSDLALSLDGETVTFTGFMAPPLKAEANFFVLTKQPMATCPFCEVDAEWPDDILPAFTKRTVRPTPFNVRIETTGTLSLERHVDPETGFLSLVRLIGARVHR